MAKKNGRKRAAKTPSRMEATQAGTNRPTAVQLRTLISQLRVEHQHHLDSIAEIDQTFRELGVSDAARGAKGQRGRRQSVDAAHVTPTKVRRGRRKGAKVAKPHKAAKAAKSATRRTPRRGKFAVTANEFILQFVKDKGNATTAEIRRHWESSGRGGKAENSLTGLVKDQQLKRTKLDGQAGSTYSIP